MTTHAHIAMQNGTELLRGILSQAEIFDFGRLICEQDGPSTFRIPELSEVERQMWHDGLIMLPSETCWFEFTLGGSRSALMVYDVDGSWYVKRFEQSSDWTEENVMVSATRGQKDPGGWPVVSLLAKDKGIVDALKIDDKLASEVFGSGIALSTYLALMLLSKTTERETVRAPAFINRTRIKKGKAPLLAHTKVRIVPWRYLSEAQREAGRSHSSPRLHWRRSHLRVYDHRTPGSTFVEGRGWCVAISRCLVGSAEHGEVSHSYFVGEERDA